MLILTFHNISTARDTTFGDYEVSVRVNSREIVSGHVYMHRRSEGWEALVHQFLKVRVKEQLREIEMGGESDLLQAKDTDLCAICQHPAKNHSAGRCRKKKCGCGRFVAS